MPSMPSGIRGKIQTSALKKKGLRHAFHAFWNSGEDSNVCPEEEGIKTALVTGAGGLTIQTSALKKKGLRRTEGVNPLRGDPFKRLP